MNVKMFLVCFVSLVSLVFLVYLVEKIEIPKQVRNDTSFFHRHAEFISASLDFLVFLVCLVEKPLVIVSLCY